MMAHFSLKVVLALLALALMMTAGSARPSSASLAWLSFPAGEEKFQEAIHDLIKNYGKDLAA